MNTSTNFDDNNFDDNNFDDNNFDDNEIDNISILIHLLLKFLLQNYKQMKILLILN